MLCSSFSVLLARREGHSAFRNIGTGWEKVVMAKRWYVLHVFSGSEKKAAQSIREQAAANGLEDQIEEVMVPTENVVEVKDLSQIEEITGPRGTAAIFDTNITHKAGQVLTQNKRLVLRIDTRIKTN